MLLDKMIGGTQGAKGSWFLKLCLRTAYIHMLIILFRAKYIKILKINLAKNLH
jgi:hypothetical protein